MHSECVWPQQPLSRQGLPTFPSQSPSTSIPFMNAYLVKMLRLRLCLCGFVWPQHSYQFVSCGLNNKMRVLSSWQKKNHQGVNVIVCKSEMHNLCNSLGSNTNILRNPWGTFFQRFRVLYTFLTPKAILRLKSFIHLQRQHLYSSTVFRFLCVFK